MNPLQIRSHAQKYFLKVQKNGTTAHVPPPRPKRKAAHPYPQKASKNGLLLFKMVMFCSSNHNFCISDMLFYWLASFDAIASICGLCFFHKHPCTWVCRMGWEFYAHECWIQQIHALPGWTLQSSWKWRHAYFSMLLFVCLMLIVYNGCAKRNFRPLIMLYEIQLILDQKGYNGLAAVVLAVLGALLECCRLPRCQSMENNLVCFMVMILFVFTFVLHLYSYWNQLLVEAGSTWRKFTGLPDFAEVYSFIGSVFDPGTTGHVQKLKEMDPIDFETVSLIELINIIIQLDDVQ